jgi:predicted O-methyltransferase YrrM
MLDPFSVKRYKKWHPFRLFPTLAWRLVEVEARVLFERYRLPMKECIELPELDDYDGSDTAVTEEQARYLLGVVHETEAMKDTVIVEIGSFRGATTRLFARASKRTVIAVDPFIGYGGSAEDYAVFQRNTCDLANLIHVAKTSGQAVANWTLGAISLLFIDAVHDWANTRFDLHAWSKYVGDGGLVVLHDTDSRHWAGTRKAAFEFARSCGLFAHTEGLAILRMPHRRWTCRHKGAGQCLATDLVVLPLVLKLDAGYGGFSMFPAAPIGVGCPPHGAAHPPGDAGQFVAGLGSPVVSLCHEHCPAANGPSRTSDPLGRLRVERGRRPDGTAGGRSTSHRGEPVTLAMSGPATWLRSGSVG